MDKMDYFKKLAAGIFFIAAVCLVVFVTLVIGIQKGLIQPKFQIAVLFKNVGGLGIGAPCRLSGVNVGTVGAIDFLDEKLNGRGVKVTLNIFKRYEKQLRRSTVFAIATEGVLGGKIVEISSSERGPYADLDQPIMGHDPIDVQDVVGVFTETANSFTQTSKSMAEMLVELRSISKSSKRLMNRLEQKLIEGNLFKVF